MSRSRTQSFVFLPFVLVLVVVLLPSLSQAQTTGIVTFGVLRNLEFIDQFYDGGKGSLGSGPGPNFGLTFTSTAQTITSGSKGGSGNFINNPGKFPVMFFQKGNNVTISLANGVDTGVYFYYSALQTGQFTVYSGANGTGNILASVSLPANNTGCTTYKMCVWTRIVVPLSATANSIVFSGVANNLAISKTYLGMLPKR